MRGGIILHRLKMKLVTASVSEEQKKKQNNERATRADSERLVWFPFPDGFPRSVNQLRVTSEGARGPFPSGAPGSLPGWFGRGAESFGSAGVSH